MDIIWQTPFLKVWDGNYISEIPIKNKIPQIIGKYPPKKSLNDFLNKNYQTLNKQLESLKNIKTVTTNQNEINEQITTIEIQLKFYMNDAKLKYQEYLNSNEYKFAGKNRYTLKDDIQKINLNLIIKLNGKKDYLNTNGNAQIDRLIINKKKLKIDGVFIDGSNEYESNIYTTKPLSFVIQSYGANIFKSNDKGLFMQLIPSDKIKLSVTLSIDDNIYKHEFVKIN